MLGSLDNSKMTLSERAASLIAGYIVEKGLEPGSRLPNELQLSQALNVGRSTIREAIRILVSRNVVQIMRGRGTVVTNKPGLADDPLGFQFVRDKGQLVVDLLEIRLIVEPRIAGLAAMRATDEDIVRMKTLAAEFEQQMATGRHDAAKDVELHACIAQCSHNEVITSLIPIINQSIYSFSELADGRTFQESVDTHRAIVQAIEAHDAQTAESAMTRHILNNQRLIEQKLQKS